MMIDPIEMLHKYVYDNNIVQHAQRGHEAEDCVLVPIRVINDAYVWGLEVQKKLREAKHVAQLSPTAATGKEEKQ